MQYVFLISQILFGAETQDLPKKAKEDNITIEEKKKEESFKVELLKVKEEFLANGNRALFVDYADDMHRFGMNPKIWSVYRYEGFFLNGFALALFDAAFTGGASRMSQNVCGGASSLKGKATGLLKSLSERLQNNQDFVRLGAVYQIFKIYEEFQNGGQDQMRQESYPMYRGKLNDILKKYDQNADGILNNFSFILFNWMREIVQNIKNEGYVNSTPNPTYSSAIPWKAIVDDVYDLFSKELKIEDERSAEQKGEIYKFYDEESCSKKKVKTKNIC